MSADERFSERADQVIAEFQAAEDRKRYEAFETLMNLVDKGELTQDAFLAIQQKLGAVSLVATYPASVYQQQAIARLERGMPEGGDA